jgi:subtilisin family serine protease
LATRSTGHGGAPCIDATLPDFAGKIAVSENFTSASGTDDVTQVASTIAGSGARSGGRYKGLALGAKLAIGRVCQYRCQESAILAGMEWAARIVPVVNLSVGGEDSPDIDPPEQGFNDLTTAHGTLFVIAAGNSGGRGGGTVDSPASADAVLAVGAVDDQDRLALFTLDTRYLFWIAEAGT